MSITCLLSHTYNDLRCPVCGEGFLILAKADNLVTRVQMRRKLGEALRAHHTSVGKVDAHSAEPFTIESDNCSTPEWISPLPLSYPAQAAEAA